MVQRLENVQTVSLHIEPKEGERDMTTSCVCTVRLTSMLVFSVLGSQRGTVNGIVVITGLG